MADGVTESTQFTFTTATLVNSSGAAIDIKFMIQDMNVYEDIFSSVITGDILVRDAHNIVDVMSLCGNEYLHIAFETPTLKPFDKYFRVYKISNLNMRNLNSYEYTMHFCSDEFVINQQIRISKSYSNMTNDNIVQDILKNKLKVPAEKISFIEETKGIQNIIVPNMKPFEAINWISSFSLNKKLSSSYLFFENRDGFNFISLDSMFTSQVYKDITINPKNIIDDDNKPEQNRYIPDRMEIPQTFDVLGTLSTGGYSSNMIKLDLLRQKHEFLSFNPIKNKVPALNDFPITNNATNRLGNSLVDGSAYTRYFPSFQGNLVDKWLLQRATQLSLLNSFRMNIQLSGDSQLRVGAILNVDYPSIQPTDSSQKIKPDNSKSGKYIVTSLRHRIFNNKYINYLEICKDSMVEAIPEMSNGVLYDKAKKS